MPEYELIKAKYPDYTAQKLIDKDEYLEMTCLDMAKKMSIWIWINYRLSVLYNR